MVKHLRFPGRYSSIEYRTQRVNSFNSFLEQRTIYPHSTRMRSCLGSILLIIVLAFLAITAFYQWNTNSKIDFSIRKADDPVFKTEKYPVSSIKEGKVPEINSLIEKDAMNIEIIHPAPSAPSEPSSLDKTIPSAEEIPDALPIP